MLIAENSSYFYYLRPNVSKKMIFYAFFMTFDLGYLKTQIKIQNSGIVTT